MKSTRLVVATLCSLFATFVVAGEPEARQSTGSESVPNSRDTDLRVLLREVGARMHKHFVVDPRVPQAIDLGGLEHQDITYPQLLSVLHVNGIVVIADDGIMQVIPNTEVRQAAVPVVSPDSIKTLDDEWVTCIVPVKNISAAQLIPMLRPLVPQYGHMSALPDRNAIIIIDRTVNVRRLVELIKILESLPRVADSQAPKAP
jgi:general secretion pathway protein D